MSIQHRSMAPVKPCTSTTARPPALVDVADAHPAGVEIAVLRRRAAGEQEYRESAQQHHNPLVKSLVIPELREHAPFDELEPEALDYLAHRLRLAYHARGELILGPDGGVVDRLRIVKQGAVRGSGGPADVLLGPGEAFPLGALVGRRATAYHYRADADTFCWELEAERFHG